MNEPKIAARHLPDEELWSMSFRRKSFRRTAESLLKTVPSPESVPRRGQIAAA
jgi:hypothetical protein